MGTVIFLPTVARPADASLLDILPDPGNDELRGWQPEQFWLSQAGWTGPMLRLMAEAVATAIWATLAAGTVELARRDLLRRLWETGQEAAALRLAARILRGPRADATPAGRDLAGAALFVAAIDHHDLLAAVEFAAEASGRAICLEDLPDDEPLPPGIQSVGQLASRMRRSAREVLGQRLTWPDLDTIGPCLARALAADPLQHLPVATSDLACHPAVPS